MPGWFQSALRTEFYVKVGIVLMGATLPFTIILQAGPLGVAQATIVAVVTFVAIYFAATRLFGLDRRFGAPPGAGGSICGVSAVIAIGGACRAEKSHASVAISMVIAWAVAMIFILHFGAHRLGLAPGVAGATQYSKDAIGQLKTLRGWAFTWTFPSIGFTTRPAGVLLVLARGEVAMLVHLTG